MWAYAVYIPLIHLSHTTSRTPLSHISCPSYTTPHTEPDIRQKLKRFKPTKLECDDPRNKEDLQQFFQHMILSLGLPEEEAERGAATLAKKAAGRFIYARFVEEQLRGHTSSLKLAEIDDLPTGLDAMYTSYFERMFVNEASMVRKWEEVQPLVEMIAAAPEPLPLAAVAPALALSNKHTMGLAKDVVAFFTLKGAKGKLRFYVYHKSIMDYFCRHEDREDARRRGLAEQGRGVKKGGEDDEKEEEDDE